MPRICPSMHEAYSNGFYFIVLNEPADCRHDIIPIERNDLVALIIHALAHADDSLARNERLRFGDPRDVLDLVVRKPIHTPDGAHDLGGIFESFGRNEADFYAAPGDESVCRDGAAVFKQHRSSQ